MDNNRVSHLKVRRGKYLCGVCNDDFDWGDDTWSRIVPFGPNDYRGWEEYFLCCSTNCKNNSHEAFKEWLKIKKVPKNKRERLLAKN